MEKKIKQYRMLKFSEFPKTLAKEADPKEAEHPKRYCFVLGAGASKSSGIKTGEELVRIWEEEMSQADGEEHQRWKDALGITKENQSSFYGAYFSRKFQDPWDGHFFLEREMQGKHPGAGYVTLADILCNTLHNLVITTNFDRMTEDAIARYQKKLPMVIGHEYLIPYYRPQISRPYIMKIHRDLLLDPKNSEEETEELTQEWKNCLDRVFQSYNPIFIGYAGNDRSLMEFLNENAGKFRNGTWRCPYWTLYQKTALSPAAERFMNAAGGWVVQDCDFDLFFIRLGYFLNVPPWPTLEEQKTALEEDYRRINEKMNAALSIRQKTVEFAKAGTGIQEAAQTSSETKQADAGLIKQTEELSQAVERLTGDTDPESRGARYRKAIQAYNRENYTEAEALLRQLVKEEPENAGYHDQLSTTLHEIERYEEAEAEERRAVELEPENAIYHNQLGVTLHEMKRYEEARAEKQRAVELEPENAFYHDQLGVTLHEMKRYEEARAEKQRAVELGPENAGYHASLGVTLREMGRYEEALRETEQAIALEPEEPDHYDRLESLYSAWGKPKEARKAKEQAEKLRKGK